MHNYTKSFIFLLVECCMLAVSTHAGPSKMTETQNREMFAMITNVNHSTFAYQAAVMQRMLEEANFFSDRLKLPTPHPIQMDDVKHSGVSQPWFGVILDDNFARDYYSTNIPREDRLKALKIGVRGIFETTNFFFSFIGGRLYEVQRLKDHLVEYCASIPDLDKLAVATSLINDAQAHELATQWLAAVDVDVARLERDFTPTVSRVRYNYPPGTTNIILLPIYFVEWDLRHYSNADGSNQGTSASVEVKILGTTKELIEYQLRDGSFSGRPLMLVTNALDLVRTPNPPMKHLQSPMPSKINSP
jgi:hypothetical protein